MIKIIKDRLDKREEIFSAVCEKVDVSATVKEIIENVKANGDKALYYYAEKFDKATLSSLRVTKEEIEEAISSVDAEFVEILKEAA